METVWPILLSFEALVVPPGQCAQVVTAQVCHDQVGVSTTVKKKSLSCLFENASAYNDASNKPQMISCFAEMPSHDITKQAV